MLEIPVLIVGAGPVGLAMSMALSRQGIRNIVIEKHPSTSIHPKARGVNLRTMELCRLWQSEEKIREYELPSIARRFLWMDKIKGEIAGSVPITPHEKEYTPSSNCLIAQDRFEQAMLHCLQKQKNSEIRFHTKLTSFDQKDDKVSCELKNIIDNTSTRINCQYLVAADGSNSFVRERLNISMQGLASLGTHVSVYCEVDLSSWLRDKPFAVMALIDPSQMGRIVLAVDLDSKWIFSKRLEESKETLTPNQAIEFVRATVEEPNIPVKVIDISKWEMAALNADHYQHQRIFLCGDAAHRIPPTGGMGLNTGIGDAHNLAWKLAHVIKGYADKELLKSYQEERKPLAQITIDWSTNNAKRIKGIFSSVIEGNQKAFEHGLKEQQKHINHLGLDIGFIYRSDSVYPDSKDNISHFDPNHYQPKAVVGMRAPHCWVQYKGKKISILDLFEKDYVLLIGEDCQIDNLTLPLPQKYPIIKLALGKDLLCVEENFYEIYKVTPLQAILVRPDGHIAYIS